MPSVPEIIQMRQKRRKVGPFASPKTGLSCSILLSLLLVILSLSLTFFYVDLTRDLPSLDLLQKLLSPTDGLLSHPTQLLDRSGSHILLSLENPAAAQREYLFIDPKQAKHFSPSLIIATVATADPDFWTHPGFLWSDLFTSQSSTIAERLVTDLLIWDYPHGFKRELLKCLLAAQITHRFGRGQILEWYLNSTNYGRLAFGADAAARVYFGKPASEINLAEAAMLAGITDAPALNPIDAPQAAKERQKNVLQTLLVHGLITHEQAEQARQTPIIIQPAVEWRDNPAPVFTQMALKQISAIIGWDRLERGGLRIITTLDYGLQVQATCATQAHLSNLLQQNQEIKTINGEPCEASRLLPTLSLKSDANQQADGLGSEVIITDPHRGQILALVAEHPAKWDSPLQGGRPAGTLLTPFVYLSAFTRGFTPATLTWDIPTSLPGTQTEVPCLDKKYDGPMRLRNAMTNDDLPPLIYALSQTGLEITQHALRQLGLDSVTLASNEDVSLSLWDKVKVTLLELARAYGILANGGIAVGNHLTSKGLSPESSENERRDFIELTLVQQVSDINGNILFDLTKPQKRAVISPQLAYLVTHILSDETARWRTLGHPNHLEIGRPAAAKIGQTLERNDTWAFGYTPVYLVGVWVGSGSNASALSLPTETAAALWHAIIQYASRDLPASGWLSPPGISTVEVCDPSGLLPGTNCPNIVSEVFLQGSEPTQTDNLYRLMQVNRETGKLATISTNPDLIEEQVYLALPAEISEHVAQFNLPTLPNGYDTIFFPTKRTANAQITKPDMLAYVAGEVSIEGRANSDNFAYYKLQVGSGLYPQAWMQIGDDVLKPVENGQLAIWDTRGLNGLYALQLLVVDQDQYVDLATLQVVVDNQPPEIIILSPQNGQIIQARTSAKLTFQASANDLALASLTFYLDNRRLTQLTQPPFAVSWEVQVGEHILRVDALDQAGNRGSAEVKFNILP